jgi:hypothetical protein
MVGTCSIITGHQYWQEPQVTQSHIDSNPIVSMGRGGSPSLRGNAGLSLATEPSVGVLARRASLPACWISFGESSLPVRKAGQFD